MTNDRATTRDQDLVTTVRIPRRFDQATTVTRHAFAPTLVSAPPIFVEPPPRTKLSARPVQQTDAALVLALAVLSLTLGIACGPSLALIAQALLR